MATVLAPVGVVSRLTLNGTVSAGDLIGYDGTGYVLADANATASIRFEYVALEAGIAADVIRATRQATLETSGLTAGGLVFVSATAGGLTQTNPITATAFPQVVGIAKSTTVVDVDANYPHIFVPFNLAGADAATAANYGYVFVAPIPCRLVGVYEVHRTAGSDGGSVTLDIEKLTTGTAQDSGASMLASTINLKGTANTPVVASPTTTAANARLDVGDSVALDDAGTLTAVADVSGTLIFVAEL